MLMQNKYLDDFLTNICGFKCFIIRSKKQIKKFTNIKSRFLLVLRSNEKLNSSDISGFKVNVKSKLIQFKKKLKLKKKSNSSADWQKLEIFQNQLKFVEKTCLALDLKWILTQEKIF